jgi:hypothetical protein
MYCARWADCSTSIAERYPTIDACATPPNACTASSDMCIASSNVRYASSGVSNASPDKCNAFSDVRHTSSDVWRALRAACRTPLESCHMLARQCLTRPRHRRVPLSGRRETVGGCVARSTRRHTVRTTCASRLGDYATGFGTCFVSLHLRVTPHGPRRARLARVLTRDRAFRSVRKSVWRPAGDRDTLSAYLAV